MSQKHRKHTTKKVPVYSVGHGIFFHAFVKDQEQELHFMCEGYITRQPQQGSKTYKVVIVAVDPKPTLGEPQPQLAKTLLGKKITRSHNQLLTKPTGLLRPIDNREEWLCLNIKEINKIQQQIRKE